jgi:hypothetical protein
MTVAICDHCGRLRELDGGGRIIRHRVPEPVTRASVHSASRPRKKPRCPGSGQAPRRVER